MSLRNRTVPISSTKPAADLLSRLLGYIYHIHYSVSNALHSFTYLPLETVQEEGEIENAEESLSTKRIDRSKRKIGKKQVLLFIIVITLYIQP